MTRSEEQRELVAGLHDWVRGFDTALITARMAKGQLEGVAVATRLCQGAATLLSARVAETKVWGDDGARSPVEYLAKATGTSVGQAIGMLETAERLSDLPATEAVLRAGSLSPAQAHPITTGATADPNAEAELLAHAERASVRGLQMRARTIEAAARPELVEGRYRAAHADRDFTTWVDTLGVGRAAGRPTTWPASAAVLPRTSGTSCAPRLDNEVRVCGHHHDLVTHHGYDLIGNDTDGYALRAPGRAPPDTG